MTHDKLDILEQAIPEFITNLKTYGTTSKALEALKRTFKSNNITIQDWNLVLDIIGQQSDLMSALTNPTSLDETLSTILNKIYAALDECQTDLTSLDSNKASRTELATKLDKVATGNVVYANNSSGVPASIVYSENATGSTIPIRDASGHVSVGTPSTDNDATTKAYVDSENTAERTEYRGLNTAAVNRISTIEGKIPTQATSSNQLADKSFVNSTINSLAAYYITKNAAGDPFATKAELISATTVYSGGEVRVPTRNDYCIVNADETHNNAACRYIYQGSGWQFQFKINDAPFTAEQLAAINSGATSELIDAIPNLITGKQNKVTYSATAPQNPQDNDMWVKDTGTENTIQYTGTGGVSVDVTNATIILNLFQLLNYIYPVGSIYLSANNVSPEIFLGGTWERIQDKFLLTAGSTYSAGATGGAASYSLTMDNIPEHNHGIYYTKEAQEITAGTGESGGHSHTIEGSAASGYDLTCHIGATLYGGDWGNSGMATQESPSHSNGGGYNTAWQGGWHINANHTHTLSGAGTHSHSITFTVDGFTINQNTGNRGAATVTPVPTLPPYLTVYAWKRIA